MAVMRMGGCMHNFWYRNLSLITRVGGGGGGGGGEGRDAGDRK